MLLGRSQSSLSILTGSSYIVGKKSNLSQYTHRQFICCWEELTGSSYVVGKKSNLSQYTHRQFIRFWEEVKVLSVYSQVVHMLLGRSQSSLSILTGSSYVVGKKSKLSQYTHRYFIRCWNEKSKLSQYTHRQFKHCWEEVKALPVYSQVVHTLLGRSQSSLSILTGSSYIVGKKSNLSQYTHSSSYIVGKKSKLSQYTHSSSYVVGKKSKISQYTHRQFIRCWEEVKDLSVYSQVVHTLLGRSQSSSSILTGSSYVVGKKSKLSASFLPCSRSVCFRRRFRFLTIRFLRVNCNKKCYDFFKGLFK